MHIVILALALAQHPAMPAGMTHEQHLEQMKKEAELKERGALAMGFDQDATVHHFLRDERGGTIQVTAKDPRDRANVDAIRTHLRSIAREFAAGTFDKPLATHGETPAGVPAMIALKDAIVYRYEEVDGGGRVRIVAAGPEAVAAVHDFLRYQAREHRTGDPR